MKEALLWSAFWISIALIFNVGIYYCCGYEAALSFFTGYLIEKSLSVDNLFVFLMIFSYFKTPSHLQHKVLFWGILGAICMRALFISAGIVLIHYFEGILYIFALFLIYAGIGMLFKKDENEVNPKQNPVIKWIQKTLPITKDYAGNKFFVRHVSGISATPLFVVLVAIEISDVIFALDSIPAILAITRDPFIVYTSNILAILGLRSLFFALAHLISLFHYLNYALSFILTFIGIKMLLADFILIPTLMALGVTFLSLGIAIIFSILYPKHKN